MPKHTLPKEDQSGNVLRLRRSLYGLKNAARTWNKLLFDTLSESSLKEVNTAPYVSVDSRQWFFIK